MDGSDREHRWRSYSSFGLFRDDLETNRKNRFAKSRRFQLSFAIVAIALLIVTGVFVALQVTRSTREPVAKAKRFVRYEEVAGKEPQKDVDIVPEAETHPNHRYEENHLATTDQIMERVMKNMYSEWSPEGGTKSRNNIRDIIRRIEMGEKLRKSTGKRSPGRMGMPILFKGVYTKKAKTDGVPEDDSDTEYIKEINDMLLGEDKPSEEKIVPSRRGSPFQLKDHVDEIPAKETDEIRKKTKKPITVMLDIYPIAKPEEEIDEKIVKKTKPDMPPFLFSEPIPSGGRNVAYTLVPLTGGRPNKNRMIMKVNLYPKRIVGREFHRLPPQLNRRTFGWFKKEPEGRVCQLVGHNPEWEPVTAEWKDEHGDWIKANYVTLKYWDRKFA